MYSWSAQKSSLCPLIYHSLRRQLDSHCVPFASIICTGFATFFIAVVLFTIISISTNRCSQVLVSTKKAQQLPVGAYCVCVHISMSDHDTADQGGLPSDLGDELYAKVLI